jgi:ABC-type Fe3+ transport system substrate-binding protein
MLLSLKRSIFMKSYNVLEEQPVFAEDDGGPIQDLDYLGYVPCPIRTEMQRQMHLYFSEQAETRGTLRWYSPYGCNHHGENIDPYDLIWKTDDEVHMPGVISDGGSSDYFRPEGHKRWIESGVYGPIDKGNLQMRPEFVDAGIEDPMGACHIFAAFPSVWLVDKKKLGSRPMPKKWEDLQDPIYRGDITLAGHEGDEISDVQLFNVWKHFGEQGLKALAKNATNFWSPAMMVKRAGASHPDGTAIYVLNYFFARSHRYEDRVELVWPEDGAWFNPLLLLAKRKRRPESQIAIDFLLGEQWRRHLDSVGFPSVYTYPGQKALPGKLSWIGWDFIRNHDLDALSTELQAVFQNARPRFA